MQRSGRIHAASIVVDVTNMPQSFCLTWLSQAGAPLDEQCWAPLYNEQEISPLFVANTAFHEIIRLASMRNSSPLTF